MRMPCPSRRRRVFRRTEKVRLQNGANRARVQAVQVLGQCNGRLGVGRPFHVDANEVPQPLGMRHHVANRLLRKRGRHIHADARQLYADVRVQLFCRDRIEQLVVDAGGRNGFIFRSHAFAQRIQRNGEALPIQVSRDTQRVIHGKSRDKNGWTPCVRATSVP